MGDVISLFTRQPIHLEDGVRDEQREWFEEWAKKGPENLDAGNQAEWIILFHEYYLQDFLDAAEGIRDATEIADLEAFMGDAIAAVKKWPKT